MKRIMGLVLAIVAFAVVADADRIAYGSAEYAARTGEDFWSLAPSAESVPNWYLAKEPAKITQDAGRSFHVSDDLERLNADVFYSDFADSLKSSEDRVELDSIRRRSKGFVGVGDDGHAGFTGVEHTDPFRQVLAVAEVPEPETLLLVGMGLLALAAWKRRRTLYPDDSEPLG